MLPERAERSLAEVRDDAWEIRRIVLECAVQNGTCHIGSALSLAEILAVARGRALSPARGDRLVLSKATPPPRSTPRRPSTAASRRPT